LATKYQQSAAHMTITAAQRRSLIFIHFLSSTRSRASSWTPALISRLIGWIPHQPTHVVVISPRNATIASHISPSPHSLTIITIAVNIQVGIASRKNRVAASVGAVK
jgi:hypothetical protein